MQPHPLSELSEASPDEAAGGISVTQWWPLGKPVPDGWSVIRGQYISHHHTYGVLIEKIDASE